jgi:hypothetical protein
LKGGEIGERGMEGFGSYLDIIGILLHHKEDAGGSSLNEIGPRKTTIKDENVHLRVVRTTLSFCRRSAI